MAAYFLVLFLVLLPQQTEQSASKANEVLMRWKRASSYLLEELFEGNLEKECYEEICVYEEAREVFENDLITNKFWKWYMGGTQCVSQPCLNNASCHDNIRSYTCNCSHGYEGRNCAYATNECHPERPNGCQHFCHPGQRSYICSCAQGYKVGADDKSCIPNEKCACGILNSKCSTTLTQNNKNLQHFPWQSQVNLRIQTGLMDKWFNVHSKSLVNYDAVLALPAAASLWTQGNTCYHFSLRRNININETKVCNLGDEEDTLSQVKLTNSQGKDFCGGVIIQDTFVLTTANCSLMHRNISVTINFNRTSNDPLTIKVKKISVHMRYNEDTGENNVSLLELEEPIQCPSTGLPICVPENDFAEHILIPRKVGLVSGWTVNGTELVGSLMKLPVEHLGGNECGEALNVTVTTRMYCERSELAARQWAEGSIVTREHQGAWFLTGLMYSAPAEEYERVFLFTKISRYSLWFRQIMNN